MADLLTPTFFDDCEGVTNVNGTPVVDFSPVVPPTGGSYNDVVKIICEDLRLTERFMRDPLSWLNAVISPSAGKYLRVNAVTVAEDGGWALAAGMRDVSALDYVEALTMSVPADDVNDVLIDYYVE